MSKIKSLSIVFIILLFVLSTIYLVPEQKLHIVSGVKSPLELYLDGKPFRYKGYDCFDSQFSDKNRELAKKLNITEEEAFLLGNLGNQWAANLMKGRNVYVRRNNELVNFKFSYPIKFENSGFCLKDSKPCSQSALNYRLYTIRKGKFKVLDLDNDRSYGLSDERLRKSGNYMVMRQTHIPEYARRKAQEFKIPENRPAARFENGKIKILFSDSTVKLKLDKNCNSPICKEILQNINKAQNSIDIAIYGYSEVPEIEQALKNAVKRGVKLRLVYDLNSKGENIYDGTGRITKIIPENNNDGKSGEANSIMHNKFYIFDNRILITGSANLSSTDMSGFNSNSIVVIDSVEAARIYRREFEQMFEGKFHNMKEKTRNHSVILGDIGLDIYFSPQDKSITNAILPLIRQAKKYIYIPAFVITDRKITEALTDAQSRGVDVRVIIDALNASGYHSKHNILREKGIKVKTENYAGKMHSKSIIIDDKYTIAGSMNFSYSGENKNDENIVVIRDSGITKFYRDFFLYQWGRIDDRWLKYNARAEGKDSIGSCSDGIDNNYDGLTDSQDPACKD